MDYVTNHCHANTLFVGLLPKFYPLNLQHSSCKHISIFRVEDCVDPYQMTLLADQDLYCFIKRIYLGSFSKNSVYF